MCNAKTNEEKQIRISDIITPEDISGWSPDIPVEIAAGTGKGKSYFIKNVLYEVAKQNDQKILMLLHRNACKGQFIMEIDESGKTDHLTIMSYQKMESILEYGNTIDLSGYKYIVSDEYHYFTEDAAFNDKTEVSLRFIMNQKEAIKIFMSATGDCTRAFIENEYHCKFYTSAVPEDWSFIDHLAFFYPGYEETLAKAILEDGHKGIFFINNAAKAYALYKKFKDNAIFNCSERNALNKAVDRSVIDKILRDQKFDKPLLITTSCMDAGLNLIDPDIKYIIAEDLGLSTLIQCIGRKRRQSEDDKIDLYVLAKSNNQLGGALTTKKTSLEEPDYLLTHSMAQYIKKYGRAKERSNIIYEQVMPDGAFVKRVNRTRYEKVKEEIKEIEQMLAMGKSGFSKYIAARFGRYDPETGKRDYDVIYETHDLKSYLSYLVGKMLLTPKDRNELIEKIGLKMNGRIVRNRNSLNGALKERKIPFFIEQTSTTRVENGKTVKYQSVWRVTSRDQAVE